MEIIKTSDFNLSLGNLPNDVQRLYIIQEKRFKDDWRDPRLHTKKLKGETAAFSFRITREYRVLFMFVASETALFVTIGHRKDVYR